MRHGGWIGVLALTLAVGSGACALGEMHPGASCGSCHTGDDAPAFGAAGTVYAAPQASADDGVEGAIVEITDAAGTTLALRANDAGNFYTKTHLTPPLQVTISRDGFSATMADAPSGDCNSCHAAGASRAPGRVFVP